jgi:ABC-type Na+ efflux pump permease subunit
VSGRGRLGRTLRIARWEVARSVGTLDRQTVAVGVVALLAASAVVAVGVTTGGVAPDRGIYRVGVAPDSPYRTPVADTSALTPRPADPDLVQTGGAEVVVTDDGVVVADSQKGRAALAAFREAVRRHNLALMEAESNRSAAFPVVVTLRYVSRGTGPVAGAGGGGDGGADGGGGAPAPDDGADSGDDALAAPAVGGGTAGLFGGGRTGGSPAEISPPFPFASLVLAFLFLVPMNFVVQAYGSSVLEERIGRRGELLLVSPASPGEIVAGKTLPYLAGLVVTVAGVAALVGGGPLSVAAVLPLGLTFLGATFAAAMFARSFKELTFVTVSVSVFLTAYAFVPAIFTDVTPVALISPLTLVVRDLQGATVTVGEYLFSTGPAALVGLSLFVLGVGIYREEDMFTQRAVPLKLLDALAARIAGRRSAATLAALSIPFVLLAELLALALLFAVPREAALPVLFVAIAVVEEVAKSLHVYAGLHEGPWTDRRTVRAALPLGVLAGLGFFVGEKAFVVVQVVGLSTVALGEATAATAGVLPTAGLLVAPLVLHAVTASASAVGATRGPRGYLVGLAGAVVLHAAYNLAVVSSLG